MQQTFAADAGADGGADRTETINAAQGMVERGRYLADAGNCYSCHTSRPDQPFAGGVAFKTPLGTLYSTNITPHRKTGIGRWSANDLRRAMHEGIGADGRRLFPAFPYPSYTLVSDEDIDAIHAYLATLTPIESVPPRNSLAFTQRWAMRLWNAMFFKPQRFESDPQRSPQWNRGAYLVNGLGHCGACHTPRNRFMAEIETQALSGGMLLDRIDEQNYRPWYAVNLTGAPDGLDAWRERELEAYLHTGFSRRAGTFGPMNEVIVNSLSKLDAEDVRAMAHYLKSLPPSSEKERHDNPGSADAPDGTSSPETTLGGQLYQDHCSKCHGEKGRGNIFSAPPLAGSAVVQGRDAASLLNVIIHGPRVPPEVSFGQWEDMPGYARKLNDEQITALANYLRTAWGHRAPVVTEQQTKRQR